MRYFRLLPMNQHTTPSNGHAVSPQLVARMAALRDQSALAEPVVDALTDLITSAADEALFRTNPYRFADWLKLNRPQALDLFLYAAHAGVFDLDWGVVCPNCGSFITTPGGLRAVRTTTHCTFCRVDVPASPDDNIEVAFTVTPAVRRIRFHSEATIDLDRDWLHLFFSTNRELHPAVHDVMRDSLVRFCRLSPGDRETVHVQLEPGLYAVDIPRLHVNGLFDVQDGEPTHELTFDLYEQRIVPDSATLGTGPLRLTFHNRTGKTVVYAIMKDPYTIIREQMPPAMVANFTWRSFQPYVTAKQVATSQVFRDLFRAESIPSDLGVSFRSMTFLFSDLKGSTQLYERVGDIRAYEIVREHFTLLSEITQEMGGAVVKTIGDAVMASFAEPLPALHAALLMRRAIARLSIDGAPLQIKIGLHAGPCLAVESNDRLDYFGRTINIAARVQASADAGEIVITDPIFAADGALDAITAAGLRCVSNCGTLRGIDDQMQLHRLVMAG